VAFWEIHKKANDGEIPDVRANFSQHDKLHYNECRPHQSFDNKTSAEVRIAATGNNQEYSPPREMDKWDAIYRSITGITKPAIC